MPKAHLYLFSDACPTDWVDDGQGDTWHTIVNFVHQSDPKLQLLVDEKRSHEEILSHDTLYSALISKIQSGLPSGKLQKWGEGRSKQAKERYRTEFCSGFAAAQLEFKPIVSACSFQGSILRASKDALLASYNQHIGGIEGRGIGFEEFTDEKGRQQMKHSFLNSRDCYYHEIQDRPKKLLVQLLMSWFVADQYVFFFKDIVRSGRYGFDGLNLTVVSDTLSGDDSSRPNSEKNLRNLIDPEGNESSVVLTRSPVGDTFSGDLLVDNLAGWLTSAMNNPAGEHAQYARQLIPTGVWNGWHQLVPSSLGLEGVPAVSRLVEGKPVS